MKSFKSRTIYIILACTLLVIFIAYVFLNNLTFRANPTRLSTFLSPQSAVVQIDRPVKKFLTVQTDRPTQLASLEFEILYDQNQLRFQDFVIQEGWRNYKQQTDEGRIKVVIVPSENQGRLASVHGQLVVGGLEFVSLIEGQSSITINPETMIIMVSDSANNPSIFNAVSSVQESMVTISSTRPATAPYTPPAANDTPEITGGQKIVAQDLLIGYSSVAVFTNLKHPARIELQFGRTAELGSTIESNEISERSILRLSGLTESSRYYYRLKATGQNSQIVSSLQSFTTGQKSAGGQVDFSRSELLIQPNPARNISNVLAVLRDNQGNVLDTTVSLQVLEGQVTLSKPVNFGGIMSSIIESKLENRQSVEIRLLSEQGEGPKHKVTFDPNMIENVAKPDNLVTRIPFDERTTLIVLLLIGLMVISVKVLTKLIRTK